MKNRNRLLPWMLILLFTSCVSVNKMNFIPVEIIIPPKLSPGIEKIGTIALFSRDMIRLDTTDFQYFFHSKPITDTTIHNIDNYNTCIDALAEMLVNEGHFVKVINFRDSLNAYIRTTDTTLFTALYDKLGADALVFLDRYKLNDFQYQKGDIGTSEITANFKEFSKSASLANMWGSLIWTVRMKGDTTRYEFLQMDDLYYGDAVNPEFFGSDSNHKQMLHNTSVYFGKQFSEKLIPSWQQADRSYYLSKHSVMKRGARCCVNGEWLKAAEAYRQLIDNKNQRLSSRAAYNMALVCEMSGEQEAAIDWLTRSESNCPSGDALHKKRCREYLLILKERQQEMKQLDMLKDKKEALKKQQ